MASNWDPFDFDYELAVVGLDGQTPRRLTRQRAFDNYPAWSPDGVRVAFVSDRDVPDIEKTWWAGLYTMAADGADVRRLGPDLEVAWQSPAWTPDGRSLAVAAWRPGETGLGLYVVHADGAEIVRLSEAVSGGSWSPDGTRLAFAKSEGAEVTLYTIAADGSDVRRVTTVPYWQAWIHTIAWSPDGAKLLYACGDRQFCVVTRDGQPVSGPCPGRVDGSVCYSRGWRGRGDLVGRRPGGLVPGWGAHRGDQPAGASRLQRDRPVQRVRPMAATGRTWHGGARRASSQLWGQRTRIWRRAARPARRGLSCRRRRPIRAWCMTALRCSPPGRRSSVSC